MPFYRPLGERSGTHDFLNLIRPLQDKHVIIGQRVILECQVTGHPQPVIKWLKDGQNVTNCPDYEISQQDDHFRLLIRSVQLSDTGNFTIQCFNSVAIKQSTCILLVAPAPTPIPGAVLSMTNSPAPPQTPIGTFAPIFLKEPQHQILKLGASCVLEARIGGNPAPQITFWKDNKPLNNYRIKTDYDAGTGIILLRIPQLFAEDAGEYQFEALSVLGSAKTTAKILPKDLYDQWFANAQQELTKERKQRLIAQTQPKKPAPSATVRQQLLQKQHHMAQSPLLLSDSDVPFGVSESETELEVSNLSRATAPIIRNELRGLRLTEGTDAILQCNILSVPKSDVYFLKNGKPINPSGSARIQTSFKSSQAVLKIFNVTLEDMALYTVVASNARGKTQSSARIEVYPLNVPPPKIVEERVQKRAQPDYFAQQQNYQESQQQIKSHPQQFYQAPSNQNIQNIQQPHNIQNTRNIQNIPKPQNIPHQPQYIEQQQYIEPHQNTQEPQRIRNIQQFEPQQNIQQPHNIPNSHNIQHHTEEVGKTQPVPDNRRYLNQGYDRDPNPYSESIVPDQSYPRPSDKVGGERNVYQQNTVPDQGNYYQQPFTKSNQHQQNFYNPPQEVINNYQQQIVNPSHHQSRHQSYYSPSQFLQETKDQQRLGDNNFFGRPESRSKSPFSALSPNYSQSNLQHNLNFAHRYSPKHNEYFEEDMAPGVNANTQFRKSVSPSGIGNRAPMAKRNDTPSFTVKFPSATGSTINAGDTLRLFCKAVGDVTDIKWFKDSSPIVAGGNINITTANGESTLEIANAKLSDGAWYEAVAFNEFGSTSLRGRIVVQTRFKLLESQSHEKFQLRKIPGRTQQRPATDSPIITCKAPPTIQVQTKNLSFNEGQNAILDCMVSPADNLKVAWLHNLRPISISERIDTIFEFGHCCLSINSLTPEDAGDFTLIAVNPLGEARHTFTLVVNSAKSTTVTTTSGANQQFASQASGTVAINKPNFHTDLRSQEVFVGQTIQLETKFTPFNLDVVWFFNGNQVQPSSNVVQQQKNGFALLVINNASESNSGVYTVRLASDFGVAENSCTILVHPKSAYTEFDSNLDVEDVRELTYLNAATSQAPTFLTQLADFECTQELGRSYFEARYQVCDDSNTRIIWFHDSKPISAGSRFHISNFKGVCSLEINPTYPEDNGTWMVVIHTVHGQAQSIATLKTLDFEVLQLQTSHEQSLAQIGYLDAYRVHIGPVEIERPEETQSMEPVKFVRPLEGRLEVDENTPVHFEARIQPSSDPKMQVSWLYNGRPLPAAHRFSQFLNFGYIALDIQYVFAEDSGTYSCIATNDLGQVESSIELVVNKQPTGTFHPSSDPNTLSDQRSNIPSLEKIYELEKPKERELYEVEGPDYDEVPKLHGDVGSLERRELESILVAYRLTPLNDPTAVVAITHNGANLLTANRVKVTNELGVLSILIKDLISEDSGTYQIEYSTKKGSDTKSFQLNVIPDDVIKTETYHEESLGKIQYLENLNKYGREEIEDFIINEPPHFIQELPSDMGEIEEGTSLHMEAKLDIINDNSLKIVWLKDGRILPAAHKYRFFHDFGFVSLDLLSAYSHDSGTYECRATNKNGEAVTKTRFFVQPKNAIITTSHHPSSVAKIAELEAPKALIPDALEPEKDVPRFIRPLGNEVLHTQEGDNLYLEAEHNLTTDPDVQVQWYFNGYPLNNGSRYVLNFAFGYASIAINGLISQDSGTYTLVISNSAGEARTEIEIDCSGGEHMLTDTFHPSSVQKILELETPRPLAVEQPDEDKVAPQITVQLPPSFEGLQEGQVLHLEAQYIPVNDNQCHVTWYFNDQILAASNRMKFTNEFGCCILGLSNLRSMDSGVFKLVVTNSVGQAETSTKISVESLNNLVLDSSHPKSVKRIQEIESLKPALPEEEDVVYEAPIFTKPLTGPTEPIKENTFVHLDASYHANVNDSNIEILIFHNGQPLKHSSRIRIINEFGYLALELLSSISEDSGKYSIVIRNKSGEATTDFTLNCVAKKNIYLESQHPASWKRVQELENKEKVREPSPELYFEAPVFTQQLESVDQLLEGDKIRLSCRLQPVNDPTLSYIILKDGHPLPQGNRFAISRNIDLITLDINHVFAYDSGKYQILAHSNFGEAETSCTLDCQPTDSLLLDTMHEASYQKIVEIESRRPDEILYEEPVIVAPRFIKPLGNASVTQSASSANCYEEGQAIYIEGTIEPVNDNMLTVTWFHNNTPLSNGHRFKTSAAFGNVSLCILYSVPYDQGTYSCLIKNDLGEAKSEFTIQIGAHGNLYLETLNAQSLQKIQELERAPDAPAEEEAPVFDKPQFIQKIEDVERYEGQGAHFETRMSKNNDPNLVLTYYFNGHPLANSNRTVFVNSFGHVSITFLHTKLVDSGTYRILAENAFGSDQIEFNLSVLSRDSIETAPNNEASWKRVQELELPKEKAEEELEIVFDAPKITMPLKSITDLVEGLPAHFEATYTPMNDPNLKVIWYHNSRPLTSSNRCHAKNDFGYASLSFLCALAADIGDYKLEIVNNSGTASTEARLDIERRPNVHDTTFHESAIVRIKELEGPKAAPAEPQPVVYQKPTFTNPLKSIENLPEGQMAFFEGQFVPVNDSSLNVSFFFNDTPIKESNRYNISIEFGYITLSIYPVYTHDAGVYSAKIVNDSGAAISNASLSVAGDDVLFLNSNHPASLAKIEQLEGLDKYQRLEIPEIEYDKPVWIKTFENVETDTEGGVIQLNGMVVTNIRNAEGNGGEHSVDPSMKIEWTFNGKPFNHSNRIRKEIDFGLVSLFVFHVLPQDSGIYTCTATNSKGAATTSCTVKVAGYESIMRDTFNPVSWERIIELEKPVVVEEIEVVEVKEKPRFVNQLNDFIDIEEQTPIRIEAIYQPSRDNDLVCEWFFSPANAEDPTLLRPIPASQLIFIKKDLGYSSLDISAVNPDHNGIYFCKIKNTEGEAITSGTVQVVGCGNILSSTFNESSVARIKILEAEKEKTPDSLPEVFDAPAFTSDIGDIECNEGDPSRFEAHYTPTNDASLNFEILRNGIPLGHGNKYAIHQDFGKITVDIGYTFSEDSGVYNLRIFNSAGEAVSTATLKCNAKDSLLLDTQHEASWKRVQEIEAPKPLVEEVPPPPKVAPKFKSALTCPGEISETQSAHFECTLEEPIDDPEMIITWKLNGVPINNKSRMKYINDFGWVIMNINGCIPQDSGVWSVHAKNSMGEAEISTNLNVSSKENILLDSIQPQSLARIREIEAAKPEAPEELEMVYEKPVIILNLEAPSDISEGDGVHLVSQYQYHPCDSSLKVEWLKDNHVLPHSNRHKMTNYMTNSFGFAILDVLYMNANDSGEYSVKISNNTGEAVTSCKINIEAKPGLILDPQDVNRAKAVEEIEIYRNRKPEYIDEVVEEKMPVFIEPLSAPVECDQGDSIHFSVKVNYDPSMRSANHVCEWFLNGRKIIKSRVKQIDDFGYSILEINPVYPEDSGEITCRISNSVGEAVTATTLTCRPKEGIVRECQLPSRMAGAQARIDDIENRKKVEIQDVEIVHEAPRFTSQFTVQDSYKEGELIRLEASYLPSQDPCLYLEFYQNGCPCRNTNRMQVYNQFGYITFQLVAEPQDTGVWTAQLKNQHGEAEASFNINVEGDSGVVSDWVAPGNRKERIDELEEFIHKPRPELEDAIVEYGPPVFTEPLTDLGTFSEGDAQTFMCVLEPIGDPSLRLSWLHNDRELFYCNRITVRQDFGVCTLMNNYLTALDSGTYKLIATNAKGSAETTGKIVVESIIQVDSPEIVQPLVADINVVEGESIHLESRILPMNDPTLVVTWTKDNHDLNSTNRHKMVNEFGYIVIDITFASVEDSGDYELTISNSKGTASTKCHIGVTGTSNVIYTSQAANFSLENLERHLRQHSDAPLVLSEADVYNESAKQPPVFKTGLLNGLAISTDTKGKKETGSKTYICDEGSFMRFETQLSPISDPYMNVAFYLNKKDVLLGNRLRHTFDQGYVALDLLYVLPEDSGTYYAVATNKHGQAIVECNFAVSGKRSVITDRALPQGMNVKSIIKAEQNLYFNEAGEHGPREKQAPEFSIKPKNVQVNEFEPARFECCVVAYPRAKVVWYVNGTQALGTRFRQTYDGVNYFIISSTKILDSGVITVVASNPMGQVTATCNLDVFMRKDFRQLKLKNTALKTHSDIELERERWQKETMGSLGERFETNLQRGNKVDAVKLLKIERGKIPFEQMESDELVSKFTKQKDETFYDKLATIESTKQQFEGMKLEDIKLKSGSVNKYEHEQESLPKVNLKNIPKAADQKDEKARSQRFTSPKPNWAGGVSTLGKSENVESRFKRVESPPKEVNVPARDQIKLKIAKPKRAAELPENTPILIQDQKAKLSQVKQGSPIVAEKVIPHNKQVDLKPKYQPNLIVKKSEHVTIEASDLKTTPKVDKDAFEKSSIPNKGTVVYQAYRERKEQSSHDLSVYTEEHESMSVQRTEFSYSPRKREKTIGFSMSRPQPTKIGQSQKTPPNFTQQLKPLQIELAKSAKFTCAFEGAAPITVVWLSNGKEIKPSFDRQIQTTEKGSTLTLAKLKNSDAGEISVQLSNVAGKCESSASLGVNAPIERGQAPNFTTKITDARVPQNSTTTFTCKVVSTPTPQISWFKDSRVLPQDERYQQIVEADGTCKLIINNVRESDKGIFEIVAKQSFGETRCKARLNIILTQTGKGPEDGRMEGPRFTTQINPIIVTEGKAAEFRATFVGAPAPTISWFRNNEPLNSTTGRNYSIGQSETEAWLKFVSCSNQDVAEYKCEASNPGGKSTTLANLVLAPKHGKIAAVTKTSGKAIEEIGGPQGSIPKGIAPTFTTKLQPINARQSQNAKFVTEFNGTPAPSVVWSHNQKQIEDGQLNYKITTEPTKSTLEISRLNFGNSGSYSCIIRNPSGASSCETKLNLQSTLNIER